jgi:hypothetical protein
MFAKPGRQKVQVAGISRGRCTGQPIFKHQGVNKGIDQRLIDLLRTGSRRSR